MAGKEPLSKEQIKKRMFKNASQLWNIKNIENLDPLIVLLIEGLASEIYNLNNTIEDIEIRLLEKISETLTPDSALSVKCAHAVMKANPLDREEIIDKNTFFYTNKIPSELQNHGLQEIVFSPVKPVRLIKGEINYMICEQKLYKIEDDNEKTLIARTSHFEENLNKTVYLGVTFDKDIKNLMDIVFFIDFLFTSNKAELKELIPYIKWEINGKALDTKSGLSDIGMVNKKRKEDGFFETNNLDETEYYKKHFVTIKSDVNLTKLKNECFPQELLSLFQERVNQLEPQIWIKLQMPAYYNSSDIEGITVNLNAFPVTNKIAYTEMLNTANSLIHVIPLPVKQREYFMQIDSVLDSFGREYYEVPLHTEDKEFGGIYSIKRGGIERFNKRDAINLIEQVIDTYRSELTAFASLYKDNIQMVFSQMGAVLNALKERLKFNETNTNEVPTYLLLDSLYEDGSNIIDAKYWVTNCDLANGIKAGHKFSTLYSYNIEKDSIILLTTSKGGRKAPDTLNKIKAYKYILTSRDRIYTDQDIENYCFYELGDKISYVQVKKGVYASKKPKEGLVRSIDVHIYPKENFREIIKDMAEEIKTELEIHSPDSFNYRIFIN